MARDTAKNVNTHVLKIRALATPADIIGRAPASSQVAAHVKSAREAVADIVSGRDKRFLVIVGPCSIHDTDAAREYAGKLRTVIDKTKDSLFIVMRTYFEKPRTSLGWKGLIYDYAMNNSYDIDSGIYVARQLLIDLNAMEVPCALEWLDPFTPQYIGDLISWSAIGARTVESQIHRQLSSGISAPVGFKNSTDGNVDLAVTSIKVSRVGHTFMGINPAGQASIVTTSGNANTHLVLRGSRDGTNYDRASIEGAAEKMRAADLEPAIVVDCSHGNSGKDERKQIAVCREVSETAATARAELGLKGVLIESNLFAGNQAYIPDEKLKYGVSITDKCMGWDDTEQLILELAEKLA